MSAKSNLRFNYYVVNMMHYDLNHDFDFTDEKSVEINPSFNREISKVSDDAYTIRLAVRIHPEEHDETIPFTAEIHMTGHFEFEDWEKPERIMIAKNNGTAILFPYLRCLLSSITNNASLPPYTLPVMNVNKLFTEDDG